VVIDLRNIYQPDEMVAAAFTYCSIGRPKGQWGSEADAREARRLAGDRLNRWSESTGSNNL